MGQGCSGKAVKPALLRCSQHGSVRLEPVWCWSQAGSSVLATTGQDGSVRGLAPSHACASVFSHLSTCIYYYFPSFLAGREENKPQLGSGSVLVAGMAGPKADQPLRMGALLQVIEASAPGSPLYGKGWVATNSNPTVPVWAPTASASTVYTNP